MIDLREHKQMKTILKMSFKPGFMILAAIVINCALIPANQLFSQNLPVEAKQNLNTPTINPKEGEKASAEYLFSENVGQRISGHCNPLDSSLCYSAQPFPVVEFAIEKRLESVENAAIYQSPLVADMDGDCIPEIIMAGTENFRLNPRLTSGIHILDSQSGETKVYIPTPFYSWSAANSFAIADVDRDGIPEIIVAAADHSSNPSDLRGRLICYNLDGTIKWISDQKFGANVTFGYGGTVALADFNKDGIPEVYIYNEIFNAQTGVKLTDGGNNGTGVSGETPPGGSQAIAIAAKLNGDNSTLELAAGYTIYEVDIVNTNGMQGNTMIPINIEVDGDLRDGFTSVADITGDGHLDVIVASPGIFPNGRVYVYQLNGGEMTLVASATPENGNGSCCWENIGPPFIGDIDGSGQPSIGITRSLRLNTYKYNGTEFLERLWSINTNDHSGQTGMTMFDFNQDGIMEIVYRDEQSLRIINGSVDPPEDLAVFSCFSGTGLEHPIVADIDNSGSSKIVVGCADFITQRGKMAVFSSPIENQSWAPSRGIWNQYNYHVFNVNDDLTVPVQQKNNATYANGAFNNFYVQASLLNEEGTFLQRVSNLSGTIECINYDIETDQFVVEFSLFNERDASLSAPAEVKVSFFMNNPETNGSLIGTYSTSESISPGDTLRSLSFSFDQSGNFDTLFMLINLDGTLLDGPLKDDDYILLECSYENNIISNHFIPDFDTVRLQLCVGDTYVFLDSTYSEAGVFDRKILNQSACDSVILHLILESIEVIEDTVSETSCKSYYWETADFEYSESGVYSTLLVDENGCDSLLYLDLTIPKAWSVSVEVGNTCEGEAIGQASFNYQGLDELEIAEIRLNGQVIEPALTISNLESGPYQLEIYDTLGCSEMINFVVDIYEEPLIELPDLEVSCEDETGVLEINVVSGDLEDLQIKWEVGASGPLLFVEEIGEYRVDINSKCSAYSLAAKVYMPEEGQSLNVFIPNAFSPNSDGVNDLFQPYFDPFIEIIEYSLIVMDRWGNKVFESFDPEQAWDGNIKAHKADSNLFLWLLQAEVIYCRESHTLIMVGEVNLLR
ncbi:MAG: hypothetical protein EA409_13975 [Saprospirales bacterium]|nr:MAG: hypothetical protein EA409_13975 [Saprospirales bacterium]